MATPARYFCRRLFQVSRQVPLKRKYQPQLGLRPRNPSSARAFSTVQSRRAANEGSPANRDDDDDDDFDPDKIDSNEYLTPTRPVTVADLDSEQRADYDSLSKPDQEKYLGLQNHLAAIFESEEASEALDDLVDKVDREVEKETEPLDFPDVPLAPSQEGFWALDEPDEFGQVEDDEEELDESDISSIAHSELEVHREVREYTRVAAWDMPLLQRKLGPAPSLI